MAQICCFDWQRPLLLGINSPAVIHHWVAVINDWAALINHWEGTITAWQSHILIVCYYNRETHNELLMSRHGKQWQLIARGMSRVLTVLQENFSAGFPPPSMQVDINTKLAFLSHYFCREIFQLWKS